MRVKSRSWEIELGRESSDRIEITGNGQGLIGGGFGTTIVPLSSLNLEEIVKDDGRIEYLGGFVVQGDESLLDRVGQNFTIDLTFSGDDVPPFTKITNCNMLNLSRTRPPFVAGNLIGLNELATNVKKRKWEILSDDYREMRVVGRRQDGTQITISLSSLIFAGPEAIEEGKAIYRASYVPISESRMRDVSDSFDIILQRHDGYAPPFDKLFECSRDGMQRCKIIEENIHWISH